MTPAAAGAPMGDHDLYAFRHEAAAAVPAAAAPVRPRRRVWPWVLAGLALMLMVALAAGTSLLVDAVHGGLNIDIDGEHIELGLLGPAEVLLTLLGVGIALLVVIVVVPTVTLLGLTLGLMGAALGLGTALFVVLALVALATSPLWLMVLLLWLVLRRRPARRA